MKKLLFILLLLPGFASLGHDAYIYYENPDKGVRLTDLGALWDKYHKESHDQWKTKVQEVGAFVNDTVKELPLPKTAPEVPKNDVETSENAPDYLGEFTQENAKNAETVVRAVEVEDTAKTQTNAVQGYIGFILQQKAVFVFFGFALIVFILNALLTRLFTKKEGMEKVGKLKKMKNKKGGYEYGRK